MSSSQGDILNPVSWDLETYDKFDNERKSLEKAMLKPATNNSRLPHPNEVRLAQLQWSIKIYLNDLNWRLELLLLEGE